jgi:two-component system, sensor histidine kinase
MAATMPTRVLVVDDDADSTMLIATMLRHRSYDVREAYNGPEALAIAEEFRPSVAVLDLGLPGMDGCELATRLRQLPDLSGIGLIAVTGHGTDRDRQKTSAAGFHKHLVKPVSYAMVSNAVGEVCADIASHTQKVS